LLGSFESKLFAFKRFQIDFGPANHSVKQGYSEGRLDSPAFFSSWASSASIVQNCRTAKSDMPHEIHTGRIGREQVHQQQARGSKAAGVAEQLGASSAAAAFGDKS
jgi:hypothetical protein